MEVILDHLPGKQEHGLVRATLRALSESRRPQSHSELREEQQLKDAALSSPPHKRKTDIPRPYCGGLNLHSRCLPSTLTSARRRFSGFTRTLWATESSTSMALEFSLLILTRNCPQESATLVTPH